MAKTQSTPDKTGDLPSVADAVRSIEREAYLAATAAPEAAEDKTEPGKKSVAVGVPGESSDSVGKGGATERVSFSPQGGNEHSAVCDDAHGGFCVYIGPSILGVIQSGTVLKNSDAYAGKMKDAAVSKYPLVKQLLIPGERLAADRVKVKTPGTALYEYYKKLAAAVKSN